MGHRLWLDDCRPMPVGFDIHVRAAAEAIQWIAKGDVTSVSLDHDLGDYEGDGYEVACHIEEMAAKGRLGRLTWAIHSANPVGAARMRVALENADRYWDEMEMPSKNKR